MAEEFENHESGHSPVEFLGSGNCFDALSHIPNVYAVRVVNKIGKALFGKGVNTLFGKALLFLERHYNAFLISKRHNN